MVTDVGFLVGSEVDSEKENILILFKHHSRWNVHALQVLGRRYNVYYGDFSELYNSYGTTGLCERVRVAKNKLQLRAVLIDSEWCDVFNIATVGLLESILPVGLMLFDDSTMHDHNRVLASAASFVLVHCPAGVMKYQELDIAATQFFPLSEAIFINKNKLPEYDVLWYGYPDKADRREYIKKIEKMEGVKSLVYTGENHAIAMAGDLSYGELVDLISSAKITVNLSRSDFPFRCAGYTSLPRAEVYQFSGRIVEVGYVGRLCVSQYSPHHAFGDLKKYMREFDSPGEMEDLIKSLINSDRLDEYTRDFSRYIRYAYGNDLMADRVKGLIDKANKPSSRYVTRISQKYYDIAWGAIKNYPYRDEAMRTVEVDLLNQASQRVSGGFQVMDFSAPHTSQAKFYINR